MSPALNLMNTDDIPIDADRDVQLRWRQLADHSHGYGVHLVADYFENGLITSICGLIGQEAPLQPSEEVIVCPLCRSFFHHITGKNVEKRYAVR